VVVNESELSVFQTVDEEESLLAVVIWIGDEEESVVIWIVDEEEPLIAVMIRIIDSQLADSHVETQGQRRNQGSHQVERDPGVSDAVWHQLMAAKREADAAERRPREELKAMQNRLAEQRSKEEEAEKRLQELKRVAAEARELERKAELERQREEARRRVRAAHEAKLRAEAEVRAKQEAERRRREEEGRVQRKLQPIGNCVAGYQWRNMGSYYRCAGGSHTVPTYFNVRNSNELIGSVSSNLHMLNI